MASRIVILLTVFLGVCNGLSRSQLRRALGVQTPKVAALRPSVQLLDNHGGSGDDMGGEDEPWVNWTLECPQTFDIYQYMNVSGCLDDGTPLGDNFTYESATQLNIPEFCTMCNATDIYDMVMALDNSCFEDSQALEALGSILPMLAAMCTQNDAGELCVAEFFLDIWLDDGDDDFEDDDGMHEDHIGNNSTHPSPGPASTPGPASSAEPASSPAPTSGAGLDPGATPAPSPSPGGGPASGPAPGPEYEEVFWWDSLCDVEDCPWKERLLAHQFDCNTEAFIFTTLCVRDQGRYCVNTVMEFIESEDSYRDGPPTQGDHEYFCSDPCAGAVIEEMQADGTYFPECMGESEIPFDLGLACYQNNGTYCLPALADDMGKDEHELNCTFGDPAGIPNWSCDETCAASIDAMIYEFGCCVDVYFEMNFGPEYVPEINDWIDTECGLTLPPAGDCSEQYAPPRDTPECKQLREYDFDVVDTLKCLVDYHSRP